MTQVCRAQPRDGKTLNGRAPFPNLPVPVRRGTAQVSRLTVLHESFEQLRHRKRAGSEVDAAIPSSGGIEQRFGSCVHRFSHLSGVGAGQLR